MFFDDQKKEFLKTAIFVWSTNQIILHFSLLFLPIAISVFISNICSVPIQYYFYGKNVFNLKYPDYRTAKKFVIFFISLWAINTFGTSLIHNLGINKNISAVLMIPLLASISFLLQKNYVFKK